LPYKYHFFQGVFIENDTSFYEQKKPVWRA